MSQVQALQVEVMSVMPEQGAPSACFGRALWLFEQVAPLRARQRVPGVGLGWSTTLAALRSLADELQSARDILSGHPQLERIAQEAEELEQHVVELQARVKKSADLAIDRDARRAELLAALRKASMERVELWASQARSSANRLALELDRCGAAAPLAHGPHIDLQAARGAVDSALKAVESWEQRHDPREWAAASERSRVALKQATAKLGGFDALTDPTRLESLQPTINAVCAALWEEKSRLQDDDPAADVPRAAVDVALQQVRDYVSRAAAAVDALAARFAQLTAKLEFYSCSESRPDPEARLRPLLDKLHELEDQRDQKDLELRKVLREASRSDSARLLPRKKDLETELATLSETTTVLDRRATDERALLLRHADDHFPELLNNASWLKKVGLQNALAEKLDLARSGVLLSSARFSDYAVQSTLHESGGKAVFKVKDGTRDMVLKRFLLGSPDAQRYFFRQAGLLRSMNRSNLVAVDGVWVQDTFGFLLMPFYAGGDLCAWLASNPPTARPRERCVQIARDLLNAVRDLHAAGTVHCDIKPSNVMMTSGGQALIGDFDGLRQIDVTVTRVGDLQVTQAYLAPEFASGAAKEATKAMDVFALGTVFGELFQGADVDEAGRALLSSMVAAEPQRRPDVESVARNVFFDARPVELRDCGVCFDKKRREDGLACAAADRHFVCKCCLDDGLRVFLEPSSDRDPRVGSDGSVGCLQDPRCGGRIAGRDLARFVSESTWARVLEREQGRREAEMQQQLRSEFDARLQQELARKVDDVIVSRHRDEICGLLELSCPRCKRRFYDFEGCFALTCSGHGGCGCAFCAYCLEDCGVDAHQHVAACPHRPRREPSGDDVYDQFFGTTAEFDAAMMALRTRRVRQYWYSEVAAKLRDDQRQEVARCVRPLLKDVTEPGFEQEIAVSALTAIISVARGVHTGTSSCTTGYPVVTVSSGALKFIGAGDSCGNYVSYPPMSIDTRKGFTFVACFRFTTIAAWQRVFDFGSGPTDHTVNILFTQNSFSQLRFSVYDGTGNEDSAEGNLLVGSVQVAIGRYDPGKNELTLDVRDSAGKNGLITSTTPPKPYDRVRELTTNYLGKSNWIWDPCSNLDLYALHVYNMLLPSAQLEALVAASLP